MSSKTQDKNEKKEEKKPKAKEKFQLPDLSNATLPFLIDELGRTRAEVALLDKYEGILKQRIQSERTKDLEEAQRINPNATSWDTKAGEADFDLVITNGAQTRLDTAAIKVDMGEEWLNKYYKQGAPFDTLRTPRKK